MGKLSIYKKTLDGTKNAPCNVASRVLQVSEPHGMSGGGTEDVRMVKALDFLHSFIVLCVLCFALGEE